MGTIAHDVTRWPFLHKPAEVMPVADLAARCRRVRDAAHAKGARST